MFGLFSDVGQSSLSAVRAVHCDVCVWRSTVALTAYGCVGYTINALGVTYCNIYAQDAGGKCTK